MASLLRWRFGQSCFHRYTERKWGEFRQDGALYENRVEDEDYDQYINAFLTPMESNFLEVVEAARTHWQQVGFSDDEAAAITEEAAMTAWHTVNSLCQGSDRSLNRTPEIQRLGMAINGLDVSFSRVARDLDNTIVSTEWDFGDGTRSVEDSPEHTYQREGAYLVRCRVEDSLGSRNSRWAYVTVGMETQIDGGIADSGVEDSGVADSGKVDGGSSIDGGPEVTEEPSCSCNGTRSDGAARSLRGTMLLELLFAHP